MGWQSRCHDGAALRTGSILIYAGDYLLGQDGYPQVYDPWLQLGVAGPA